MIRLALITLLLYAIAYAFTGLDNEELFHRGYCAADTWKNKYAQDEDGQLIPAPDTWYYRAFALKYQEKFPLSATALVSLTDRWHLLNAIPGICYRLIIAILAVAPFVDPFQLTRKERWLIGACVYGFLWGVGAIFFHLTYTWL